MKKAIVLMTICLIVLLAVSMAATADVNNWRVVLQLTAGNIANVGNVYVGAVSTSTDIKDSADNFLPPINDPCVKLYEMRNDWPGGNLLKSDFRAPYNNGTKVWNNFFITSSAPLADGNGNPTVLTLSWEPGAAEYALPAGSFQMTVTFSAGIMDPDTWEDLGGVHVYDLSTAGNVRFMPTDAGQLQASIMIVATVGNGPALWKSGALTTRYDATTPIQCAPVVDSNIAWFGADNSKIFKVDVSGDPTLVTSYTHAGNIRGRLGIYGGSVYGISSTGAIIKRGTATGNQTAAAGTLGTTPALGGDGFIYIASGNVIKKYTNVTTPVLNATSPDLGGATGSPCIPGTDLVWVSAGNTVKCLTSNLATIRWSVDAGAPVTAPAAIGNLVSVAAGNKIIALGKASGALLYSKTVASAITGTPFVAPDGTMYFGTADHKLGKVNVFDSVAAPEYTVLPGAGAISGTPIVGANWVAVAGGTAEDYNVYLVDQAGAATLIGVNQTAFGCVSDAAGHIWFTSSDGNLYGIE